MEISDLYPIAESKGLEFFSGDGCWYGDPYYTGPNEPHEIIVKHEGGDTKFIDPQKALEFCAQLNGGYALWHGCELVISFTEPPLIRHIMLYLLRNEYRKKEVPDLFNMDLPLRKKMIRKRIKIEEARCL